MNREELIKKFFMANSQEPLSTSSCLLYFFIVYKGGEDVDISECKSPVSKRTFVRSYVELEKRGLIISKRGKGRGNKTLCSLVLDSIKCDKRAPLYIESVTNEHHFMPVKCDKRAPLLKEKEQRKNSFPPIPPISKKENIKRKKLKESTSVDSKVCESENSLFTPTEMERPLPKKTKREFQPPSIDDVLVYFSIKAKDTVLDAEENARLFFDCYNSLDWHTVTGVKIANWKSRANMWIMDKIQKIKEDEKRNSEKKLYGRYRNDGAASRNAALQKLKELQGDDY